MILYHKMNNTRGGYGSREANYSVCVGIMGTVISGPQQQMIYTPQSGGVSPAWRMTPCAMQTS